MSATVAQNRLQYPKPAYPFNTRASGYQQIPELVLFLRFTIVINAALMVYRIKRCSTSVSLSVCPDASPVLSIFDFFVLYFRRHVTECRVLFSAYQWYFSGFTVHK